MRSYLLKRILIFIPGILFLVLLSFVLLKNAPGDPVEQILSGQHPEMSSSNPANDDATLRAEIEHRLGLDLPLFYFNFSDDTSFLPHLEFHTKNQFSRWLFGSSDSNGIIRGDFGFSYQTNEPVINIISSKIGWSLFFTLISILIAYLISVPLGLNLALDPGSKKDRAYSLLFTILFSLPGFWVAMFLMFIFCNPEMMNLLPSSGVMPTGGFDESLSISEKFIRTIPFLIIPTITYTYSSFAFLTGNVKNSIAQILQSDYIRTARAKGLNDKGILYKHALPNALLPLITIFSHVFPYAIGGSVVFETIFNIPGMGLTIFQSIGSQDYPVVITIFLFTGMITMVGFLLSDILYAIADPRISFQNTEQ